MTQPTDQDQRNASFRAALSAKFLQQFREHRALISPVLGEGWLPVGRHTLVTHAEEERARKAGEPCIPVATVITAEKDGIRRHVAVIGDQVRECASYREGFGAMLTEPDTERTIEVRGEQVHPHKHSLHWSGYETGYAPKSARELAVSRQKREANKEAKWQAEVSELADNSLFPEWVRSQAEEQRDKKKGR